MKQLYHHNYYNWLYKNYWDARCLRFCDQLPAIAYAFGISYTKLLTHFPQLSSWPEQFDVINCNINVDDQLDFVSKHQKRNPKHVLEIGAGRGDVSCVLAKLGVTVTPVEISDATPEWFAKTGQQFFGIDFAAPKPLVSHVNDVTLNLSQYDTIILVECIEHIKEEEFSKTWNNIVDNFKGYLIITNVVQLHPIPVGGDWINASAEHCRRIDDELYDLMCSKAKRVVERQGSHLVLEF